jgi:hypothetical protein
VFATSCWHFRSLEADAHNRAGDGALELDTKLRWGVIIGIYLGRCSTGTEEARGRDANSQRDGRRPAAGVPICDRVGEASCSV